MEFPKYKGHDVEPDIFVDVCTIQCAIGRIFFRGSWWVVDRSRGDSSLGQLLRMILRRPKVPPLYTYNYFLFA